MPTNTNSQQTADVFNVLTTIQLIYKTIIKLIKMKNMLLEIAENFVNSKHRYQHLFYCNDGIKKATFNKTPNGYMNLSIKEYNPISRMFGCVHSTGSFYQNDILDTIKQELNIQPIKPIVIYRANQKIKKL